MKKALTSFLTFAIVFTQTLFFVPEVSAESLPLIGPKTAEALGFGDTAYAESTDNNKIKEVYDLVTLVVDTKLMDDGNAYVGLIRDYPKLADVYDMPKRIKRFAEDLQKNSPKTVVKILTYDSAEETLLDVISALENLYKNGDKDLNIDSRLRGVVLIGDVPLPVVNKNGNRFISMFPLTDFDDKAYVYNPLTQSFDLNTAVSLQKPEIWHGVLKAPNDNKFPNGDTNRLAEFFDKNHLYHEGEDDFSTFGQKLFFGDFITEEENLNEDEYALYQNLIENMDDLAYMRFNKTWAANVANNVVDSVKNIKGIDTSSMTISSEAMNAVPDVQTRSQIMNFHKDYMELVSGYLSKANDLTAGTSRYNPQDGGVEYVPSLITMKDKFTAQYLRQSNDAIENKVNELVEKISQPLPIVDETNVTGTIGGKDFQVSPIKMSSGGIPEDLMSFVYGTEPEPGQPLTTDFDFKNLLNLTKKGGKFYINGVSSEFLTTPKLCLPYLGSTNPTRSISSDNIVAASNSYTLGINTFALSATEALERTGGKVSYGLLIEENPTYGIPAFYNNSKLEGQLAGEKLNKDGEVEVEGDIILSIMPVYVFDDIKFPEYQIDEEDALTFGDELNKIAIHSEFFRKEYKENNGKGKSYMPLIKCDNCNEYEDEIRDEATAAADKMFILPWQQDDYIDLKIKEAFERGFKSDERTVLPHAVKADDHNDYYYLPRGYDDEISNTVLMKTNGAMKNVVNNFAQTVGGTAKGGNDYDDGIYWDKHSYLDIKYFDSSKKGDPNYTNSVEEVIFNQLSPYSNLSSNGSAYSMEDGKNGLSGCFFTSTIMHDDRCLPMFATYPVLDPAGSVEPFLPDNTGAVVVTTGPDDDAFSYFDANPDGTFSYLRGGIPSESNLASNEKLVYSHQFPIGNKVIESEEALKKNDWTTLSKWENHAEVFQLPNDINNKASVTENIDKMYMDACFNMLPDFDSSGTGFDTYYDVDLYGLFQRSAENFVTGSAAFPILKGQGKKNQNIPYGGDPYNIRLYNSTEDMKLHDVRDEITLADFAIHYGLYDGIDNDEDGMTDFEPSSDGKSFVMDLDEADPKYGLNPKNIPAVSRALLGVRFNWKNPPYSNGPSEEDVKYWYPMPKDLIIENAEPPLPNHYTFDKEKDIILKVEPKIQTTIPSLIVHNEPTNYTISKQIESGVTTSLPIDDPRYVAFLDAKGQIQNIFYPNLIESKETGNAPNIAQFEIDVSLLAEAIIQIPGARDKLKILRGDETDEEYKNYIKKEIFDVTSSSEKQVYIKKNHADYMLSADSNILRDALNWNNLSIDDKHEYVLDYYLNDSKEFYPYINDPGTGYEAAYLLFDGGSKDQTDYVDFSFNKGTLRDDPELDPFTGETTYEEFVGPNVDPIDGSSTEDDDEFVTLKKFFEELINFFKDIGDLVKNLKDLKVGLDFGCGDADIACVSKDDLTENTCEDVLTTVELIPSKSIVYSDGEDYVDVQVNAYNQDEKLFTSSALRLTYSISQDALNPSFLVDEDYSSDALDGGTGVIRLRSSSVSGSATLSVQAIDYGETDEETITVESEGLLIQSSGKKISLTADSDGAQIGTDETVNLSANLIANDKLESSATNQITFTIVEGQDFAIFDGANIVNAENGIARATIKPLTKSGMVKIEAKVTDGPFYATEIKEILIGSGEPSKLELVPDTDVLIANQKSKANVAVRVLDQYGNLTADQYTSVSIFAFGNVELDLSEDRNSLMPGLQIDTTNGVAKASILSGKTIGEASVYAVLMTDEIEDNMIAAAVENEDIDFKGGIGASKKISILGDGSVKLLPKYNEKIKADGIAVSNISVDLVQTNGAKVSGYNGEIVWTLNDDTYGTLTPTTGDYMQSGTSSATFKSTTVSGKPTITVAAPGFSEIAFIIETLPGAANSLALVTDKDTLFTGGADTSLITAKLLDQYGNLAYTSSSNVSFASSINPTPTDESDGSKTKEDPSLMFNFDGADTAFSLGGLASVNIKSTLNSGKVAIIANGTNSDTGTVFDKAKLELNFKKRISNEVSDNFGKISPRALYINLLGGAFYNMGKNDFASEILFSGKSQAVLTTTAVANDKKRVLSIDGFGQINILDTNVKPNFVPATESFPFNKIKFKDETFGVNVGEVFFVPKDGLDFKLINDDFNNYDEGILVKDITPEEKKASSPKLITDVTNNSIVLKSGVTTLAKIDKYGRVSILSNDVVLRLPQLADANKNLDQSYFSMLLEWKTISIAQIQFRQSFPITTLKSSDNSSAFPAGVYIKLANENGNYSKIDSFSRYSTEFTQGIYIIDTTQDIDKTMAPGSGIDSVESANTNREVGFSNDNKNMLLFAAGNSVGESNLPYASESGIVLGDPTIRLDNTTTGAEEGDLIGESNYTHDIGQMIHSDAEGFDNIEFFDYNGDDYEDLLITFSDGRIKLLENENSNQRFIDRGIILNIPNKINSLSKVDINKDGFDDLIIGTQESCIQGEKCLYLYTNKNGSFERQKLALNTADKIYSIKTADLNGDNAEDLVIADGAGNVYVFWVNDGKVNVNEEKLGNFGIDIASDDLIDDVLVSYPSMPAMPDMTSPNFIDQEKYRLFVQIKLAQDDIAKDAAAVSEMFVDNYTYSSENEPLIKAQPFLLTKYTNGVLGDVDETDGTTRKDGSTKKVVNVTANEEKRKTMSMAVGDILEYTITIKNTSSSAINNLVVSDITPSAQKIDMTSLKCGDANCQWVATDAVLREFAIKGLSVPANSVRTIIYRAEVVAIPDINIEVGNFSDLVNVENVKAKTGIDLGNDEEDEFLDIFVKPEMSDKNVLTYFFSKPVKDELDRVVYVKYEEEIGTSTTTLDSPSLTDEELASLESSRNPGEEKELEDITEQPEDNKMKAILEEKAPQIQEDLENAKKKAEEDDVPFDEEKEKEKAFTKLEEDKKTSCNDIKKKNEKMTNEEADNDVEYNTEDCYESQDDVSIIPSADSAPESMQAAIDSLNEDLDKDGLPDSWDETPGSEDDKGLSINSFGDFQNALDASMEMAEKVVDGVGNAVDEMRCSGAGCLPIPWNYAFFAPSDTTSGIAMLAVGTPNMPYFSFMYPSDAQSNFRLYISPTLTLGMGIAVCVGPAKAGQCFIAAVPAKKIPFICDAIDNLVSKIRSLIVMAVDTVNDAVNKVSAIVSGDDSAPNDADSNSVQHNGAYGSDNSKMTFKDSINIKIPGFPGFFTNWIDSQIDEIFTKLLDLPDFYLILPDFGQLFSPKTKLNQDMAESFRSMKNVDDFFEAIQQIPLIQIQPEEVKINIPIINKQQIEKYEIQAKQLVKNLKDQVKHIKEYWTCDKNSGQATICDSVVLRLDNLIANLEKLLDTLEAYKNLPKTLAKLRFALSKYALQIVCYLDAVMDLTGGYVKRQGKIIQAWIRAVREIIDQFKGWQALLNLAIEYQTSCDECKNERYGEIGLIFQVFGSVFPELPIIQIPKWPDFVFDFSKIEMGVTVLWPDFVFKPVPLILPDLPTVTIPTIEPTLDISIDIPDFELPLPNINFDLPDLPPLPLPKLPDIPRPPKIPSLPKPIFDLAVNLKPIFKILCLIKKGLLIFPEGKVKGQIEGMTEPGVKPVLPITLNLNLKAPSYSYEAPVEFDVTFKAKFGVDTNGIYNYVKYAADTMNDQISIWSSNFNKYMKAATRGASSLTNAGRAAMEKYGISPNWSVDMEDVKEKMRESYNFDLDNPNNIYYYLAAAQDYVSNNEPVLNKKASDIEFIASSEYGNSDIVNLRNSLLAYAQSFEDQGNMFENINGLEEFNTLIASLPENKLDISKKFVSNNLDQQNLSNDNPDIVVKKVAIADNSSLSSGLVDLKNLGSDALAEGATRAGILTSEEDKPKWADADTFATIPSSNPKGIFVVNSVDGVLKNENVVSYLEGLNKNTKILFGDVDKDGDTDIIYTMRNDVYWKKNYENNKSDILGPNVLTMSSVNDYSKSVKTSVQTGSSIGNKNNSSTLTFLPQKYSDLIGYEVVLFPSLTDIDNNLYRGTYRYLLTENPEEILGKVDEIFGMGNIVNSVEKVIHQSPDEFNAVGGDLVYAVSDAGLILNGENIQLPAGSFYEIPSDSEEESLNLGVALGTIEYINKGSDKSDKLFTKTSFIYGDKLRTLNNTGSIITFNKGTKIKVEENETFEIAELDDPNSPSITMNIPNGNYFAVVYSLHSDGTKSFPSTPASVSPQICGTTSAPLPITNTSMDVAVTKVAELNAEASFDPADAGIKAYYVDTDLDKDNNNDGDKSNDPDLWSDLSLSLDGPDADGNLANDMVNPIFKLGPFEEVGKQNVVLNVVNNANIAAQQNIDINVYVPKISLEKVSLDSNIVSGSTNPSTNEMPFTLMRKRYLPRVEENVLKLISTDSKITTPTANSYGQYTTLENGTYNIDDFDLDEILYIKDSSGNIVIEIDSKTGNFDIKKDGYKYSVYDANPPSDSGKIVFKDPNGVVVGTMYFVGDPNYEVAIESFDEFTAENVKDLYGVHVTQPGSENLPNDKFEFKRYPSNDPNYPDGVYSYYLNEGKQIVAVDTAGNILSLDKRITIGKKQNNYLNDPLVHTIRFNGEKIAEVYVSPNGKFDEIQIAGPNDVPKKFPNGVSPGYLFEEQNVTPSVVESKEENTENLFTDLSGDLYDFALNLYKQGLIGSQTNFAPNTFISRGDFIELLLKMLCIVPRQAAYTDPQVFSDVKSNPWIKEAALLGLVEGYEDYDNATLNPFRPERTIDLAEAVSVIVNGLKLIEVVDGGKLVSSNSGNWYDMYFDAGLNLNKYALSGVALKSSYIITPEEAVNPEFQLTRGKALEIAYRVLDAYNCTVIDKDGNGLSDYCEAKYNITDPNADDDNDGLINSDECKHMTDPTRADTDNGGVKDGDEVKLGTNPLDKIDDQNDIDGDGLTDQEELNVYNTNPNKADTDNGGINDGMEVKENKTDPNNGDDDYAVGDVPKATRQVYETEAGVYLVPASCDSCPCNSYIEYKADLRKGDILYTIIVNQNESKIYSKSNEQKVE